MSSSFQTLPRPVIDQILSYYRVYGRKWEIVRSLLWICHSWRHATLYFLCQIYEIHFNRGSIEHPFTDWPAGLDSILPYSPSWFRSLNITVELPMTTATFSSMLQADNNVLLLDNASNLTLRLNHYPHRLKTKKDIQNSVANIELLVKYLAQVAPNVTSVVLNFFLDLDTRQLAGKYLELLNHLLLSVAGMAKKQLITLINGSSEITGLSNFDAGQDSLVHIEFMGWLQPESFVLVRRCAATLKKLFFHEHGVDRDFTGLLVGDDGKHVVYPNLISLYIHSMLTAQSNQRFPTSFVPFPRLRKLELPMSYPFADNVLFRGNQQTIQTLSMELSRPLVEILTKGRVFTASSHLNLQKVMIMDRTESLTQTTEKDVIGLIANVTHHARIVNLSKENYTGQWLDPFEARKGIFSSVKTMGIRDPYMMFTDIMQLLQMCPGLTQLSCFSMEVNLRLETLQEIGTCNKPLGENLEDLYIGNTYHRSVTDIVVATITLAIVCPDLQRLVVPFAKQIEGFKEEWIKTLDQDEYAIHAPRIRSICQDILN